MKRRLLFLLILLLALASACGSGGGGDPDPVDSAPDPNATPTVDESPRIGPDSELPPTWTPAATNQPATPQVAGEEGTVSTEGQETYVVQSGDTLAEIAAAFGVTMEALVEANNIENIDVIEVDQVLIIPR
jgi:LysM repeat protein